MSSPVELSCTRGPCSRAVSIDRFYRISQHFRETFKGDRVHLGYNWPDLPLPQFKPRIESIRYPM